MRTNAIVAANTSLTITHPIAVMAIFTMAYEFAVDTACSKLRFHQLTTIHEIFAAHALIAILTIAAITTFGVTQILLPALHLSV